MNIQDYYNNLSAIQKKTIDDMENKEDQEDMLRWAIKEEEYKDGSTHHARLLISKRHGLHVLGVIVPVEDIYGNIKCPKCGGNLEYFVSSLNGHIHGKCENSEEKGCLGWIQ
jgi:hypothetical protein